ncbi:MAG: carbohydrate ABC transporter substrate-binding protein [Lachnospiraceae bacterium]|nr:carbohydrate ABC transporter substrate-binding protein [Lachnospiraceae bacterium]
MKKKWKSLWKCRIGLFLSAALLIGSFSGCGGKDGSSASGSGGAGGDDKGQAMGRFLEEEVELPIALGNIYDMKRMGNGTIRVMCSNGDNGNKEVWDSKDGGKTWEKAYDLPAEIQDTDDGYVDYAKLSSDGQAVCGYNKIADGGITPILYLVDQTGSGKFLPFELPAYEGDTRNSSFDTEGAYDYNTMSTEGKSVNAGEDQSENPEEDQPEENPDKAQPEENPDEAQPEGEKEAKTGNLIVDLQFLGNDQVILQDMNSTIYQISTADGSVKQKYECSETTGGIRQVYVAGKNLVLISYTDIRVYDTETGEQKSTEETLQENVLDHENISAIDTLNEGESIYYLTRGGLYHYKFGGSIMEQMIDGGMNSLGAPAFYPMALAMIDEENLLVAANDANSDSPTGIVILKYTYSPDTPAKPDKEIKVYSLYNNRELGQSISRFQKEHTDIYVNYQVAISEENGLTVSDALKTLTTEIMAGKGPDLLLLDGMPVETYIEKGILKNLSSVIEKEDDYFGSILKAYQDKEGQLYAVPARFFIPMIHAKEAYYSQGEDFNTFTERKDVFVNMDPESVVEKFWYSCGAAWKKEDGTLDESKITEFLTRLKNAYGEYDNSKDQEEDGIYVASDIGGFDEIKRTSLDYGNFELAYGRLNTNIGLYGGMDYGMLKAVSEKLGDAVLDQMPGQAENVFVPAMIVGISSKSAQPEAAEELAKYLFSSEAQKVSQSGGFPVEKEAFRSVIDGHQYEGKESMRMVEIGGTSLEEPLSYDMVPTPEEEIQKLTDLAELLTTPALRDDVIKEAVIEQGEKVLKGEISPEEGTKALMQKVNIYLAE